MNDSMCPLQSQEKTLYETLKRGTVSTSLTVVLGKPYTGDIDNAHAFAWKSSCSLAVLEIS